MYIDYKVTVWKRVHFNEDVDSKKVIQILEEEGLGDVFDEELGFIEQEILFETEDDMTPEENGGYATIEVYENNNPVDNLIWSNEKNRS
jgi:hypothetical protein